jgi:hypothetical protein
MNTTSSFEALTETPYRLPGNSPGTWNGATAPVEPQRCAADFLLIGGGFFGYAREITSLLERRGRKVLWFDDRPATDTLTKAAVRLAPRLIARKVDAFVDQIAQRALGEALRDVLVIKGEALSPAALRRLRSALPNARFTLYFWDSYLNMPKDSADKVPIFDRAFTFDPVDASKDTRLRYRPLFFLDEYTRLPKAKQDIDLLFFGTAHDDRYPVLKRLSGSLPSHIRFNVVLYFPSRLVYAARSLLDPRLWSARRDEFIFKPLAKTEIQSLIARSRAVVDIERTIQTGFTMRSVETLGAGKKLVTTNSTVREADFYNPDNVAVVDRKNPVLPARFLERPYVPLLPDILTRYSLSGWLGEVLGE